MLWMVTIIIPTIWRAIWSLATDPASPALLDWIPDKQTAPLFTVNMYKQILLQSVYQITIILPFHFFGVRILGFEPTSASDTIVQTVVFNTFVFAQISSSVNSLRLDCILSHWFFMVITIIGELSFSPFELLSWPAL
jgi:Ca2+-transporting ATPase